MSERDYQKRRRVPRRVFKKRVGLLFHGQYLMVQSYQVGEGGMMVDCSLELKMDELVVLTFQIPEAVPTVVRCAVRYILPPEGPLPLRYGLEFLNLDFTSKREIRNYVASTAATSLRRTSNPAA